MNSSQRAVLTGVVRGKIQWDASLSAWTTYRIGGPADALVTLLDVRDLQEVLGFCRSEGVAWKLLGRGSNILASDRGFRGVVMVLGEGFREISCERCDDASAVIVRAGAAVSMTKLANWCCREGLSGVEFAAGIPGSVGGAVVMNAGAWGRSMKDVVSAIELTDEHSAEMVYAEDLGFSYRRCEYRGRDSAGPVITNAVFSLMSADSGTIGETMRELQARRTSSQPYGKANGGSVFRNPDGASAGTLIDAAGLKGLRIGDAQVSEKHANFIINRGRATADDVRALIAEIRERVLQDSGIGLETEIEIL